MIGLTGCFSVVLTQEDLTTFNRWPYEQLTQHTRIRSRSSRLQNIKHFYHNPSLAFTVEAAKTEQFL